MLFACLIIQFSISETMVNEFRKVIDDLSNCFDTNCVTEIAVKYFIMALDTSQ